MPRGENEKPHAGRKKSRFATNLLKTNMPEKKGKLIGKDGTFLMPHLYTSFTLGCKLGVECGINHFSPICSSAGTIFCDIFEQNWYNSSFSSSDTRVAGRIEVTR